MIAGRKEIVRPHVTVAFGVIGIDALGADLDADVTQFPGFWIVVETALDL